MLDRITDWKTTVTGLVLGLALIAAALYMLRVRPDAGTPEVVVFVGGLGTIIHGLLSRSAAPAGDPPTATKAPPAALGGGLGIVLLAIGLDIAIPTTTTGCTPAEQTAALRVAENAGSAVVGAVDGPACELLEVRSGAALAGVLCAAAAGALERGLASLASSAPSYEAVPRALAVGPRPRCRLVPVHAGGAHAGFVCSEHEPTLLAELARDAGP